MIPDVSYFDARDNAKREEHQSAVQRAAAMERARCHAIVMAEYRSHKADGSVVTAKLLLGIALDIDEAATRKETQGWAS